MTSFPRQHARTRRFSLGVPRAFVTGTGPDGPVVLFLRTDAGDDPVTHLWRHDPRSGATERLVDARVLGEDGNLPPEERARRERAREQAGGIVAFAVDDQLRMAAFALAGRLFTVDVASARVAEHPTGGPAFDPRPSPDGRHVAYHADDGVHVVELHDGPGAAGTTRPLVAEPGVSWGRAEFVAAEEMRRSRGFWWSPTSDALAVARVDETSVLRWTIADPANPGSTPVAHAYPAAGTDNAEVSLWLVGLDGQRTEVAWRDGGAEYLAHVGWDDTALTLLVQTRDQRTARCSTVDVTTGAVHTVRAWEDDAWIELVPGVPRWHDGRLLTIEDRPELAAGGTRALCVDGDACTPAGLQIRELVGVTAEGEHGTALVLASDDDPTSIGVWAADLRDGVVRPVATDPGIVRATQGGADGAAPRVLVRWDERTPAPTVEVHWSPADGAPVRRDLEVVAETPVLAAEPRFLRLGSRQLCAALFLPSDDDGRSALPVLLDPYGGPHAQRVVRSQIAHVTSQWLADQGFAVLVVDGRGSPGRGPSWERAVHRDLATPVLDDQIDALHAAAELEPRLDLDRVAIRGWSFGGYLAALAVLRRPDVFHAAVAGAPVTDWHLYDTHYTERYLGGPQEEPGAYDVSSVVGPDGTLSRAVPWDADRPPQLLLIHGLADDNVVAAHTLRLSAAMLAEGRTHRFLPLSGVTHMTPQEVVAERLLEEQVRFLRDALADRPSSA